MRERTAEPPRVQHGNDHLRNALQGGAALSGNRLERSLYIKSLEGNQRGRSVTTGCREAFASPGRWGRPRIRALAYPTRSMCQFTIGSYRGTGVRLEPRQRAI